MYTIMKDSTNICIPIDLLYHSLGQGSLLASIPYENRHPVPKNPLFVPPQKVEINCSIDSLSDIIHLLDKYPYVDNCEYNIDLKNLHKIRPELVQLNEMIGLLVAEDVYIEPVNILPSRTYSV
jgi:hypothetical protein